MRTIHEIYSDIRSAGVVPENIDDEINRLEMEIQEYLKKEGLAICLKDHSNHMNESLLSF